MKTQITHLQGYPLYETLSSLFDVLFKIIPLFLSWLLLFLIYLLMPNTRLRVWPRVIAAIIAGTLFQLWQIVFINFQIQLFHYSVVYGTFAIFPLLLIWLQFCWVIILGGAEIASAIENVIFYEKEELKETKISRIQLGFLILYHCFEAFYTSQEPLSDTQIAQKLNIPLDTTRTILETLSQGKILAAIEMKNGAHGYLPLSDPQHFTLKKIRDVLSDSLLPKISVKNSEPLKKISSILESLDQAEESATANIRFATLFAT